MRSAQIGLLSLGLALFVGAGIPVAVAEAAGGDVLWEDRFDGPSHLEDSAGAIATNSCVVNGDAVFVAGHTTVAPGNVGRLVRAYALGTGRLLWEDRHTASDRREFPRAIAAEGNGVFTAGSAFEGNGLSRGVLRAYDRRTGRVLWEHIPASPSGFGSVAVRQGRVFVTAGVSGTTGVRAYDARTGALLWQDLRDDAFGLRAITTDGRRVFVVASRWDTRLFRSSAAIRAYDQRTGTLLWQHDLVPPNGSISLDQVAVADGRVFVAGEVCCGSEIDDGALMRAYDAETGALLWATVRSVPGEFWGASARSIAALHGRVFAAGVIWVDDGLLPSDLVVGAYDAITGGLLWEDRVDMGPNDEAQELVASSAGVFVTGVVGNFSGGEDTELNSDFFVRAYDGQTGAVRWTDRIDTGILDWGLAIATQGDRVIAAGVVTTPLGDDGNYNADFFVRAYDSR